MTRIVVYPRGFMGYDIGLPVQTKGGSLDNLITSVRLNKEIDEGRRVISNSKVEKMWDQVLDGDRFVDSFDFREKILLVALHAFGTTNMLSWFRMQESSPYLTDMHKRFLNDTMTFIDTGKRSVSLFSWQHLITPRPLTASDENPELITDCFFGFTKSYSPSFERIQVSSVIQRWVSQDNGFYDLLGSLHVLFGDTGR